MTRIISSLIERRGMNAYTNVMSGRRPKWYARPFGWVLPVSLFGLILASFTWSAFRAVGIPLLVVCAFVMLLRMNDKLTAIETQLNTPPATRIILETE